MLPPLLPASELAAGIYGLLPVLRLPLAELFSLPGDPLPQGILRITGLSLADVRRLLHPATADDVADTLHTAPTHLYYAVLTASLCYNTPLGRATLAWHGVADPEALAETVAALAAPVLNLLACYLPQPGAAAAVEAALHEAFARHGYALPHRFLPPTAPTPAPDDDDGWLTMRPNAGEQRLFHLALTLTVMARVGVPHPLGKALATVAALGSDQQLSQLARRLAAAAPEETQHLDGPDLLRLYLSLNVLALLCLADLQPALLDRLAPEADAPSPWHDPTHQQQFVAWVGTHVEALNQVFNEQFVDKPAYQAAQADVQRLAELV